MKKAVSLRVRLVAQEASNEAEPQAAKTATIEVYDIIDPMWGVSVPSLNRELKALGDVESVTVKIHSRGGNALEGFAIYSLLAQFDATINVEIIGLAASAASVVAMAGDTVRISETGFMMIHDPFMCACGNAPALRKHAETLDVLRPSILKAYLRRAKLSEEDLSDAMSAGDGAGTWYNAEDALEAGLVDSVYEAPAPQNAVSLDGLKDVPKAVAQLFTEEPGESEEKPKSSFAEVLVALGEEDEQAKVLGAVLDALEDEPSTEPDFMSEAEVGALVSFLDAPAGETGGTDAPKTSE